MNWKNEAIERLTKYSAMVQAVENIPKEITRLERSVQELRGAKLGTAGSERQLGPKDDYLIGNLIKRQELDMAYDNARIWVDTTKCALSVLTKDERHILEKMYITPCRGVVNKLCVELGVEQSSVYRKRDQALYRFTMALYGDA